MKTRYKVGWLIGLLILTCYIILTNQDYPVFANLWIPIYYMLIVISFSLGELSGLERGHRMGVNLSRLYDLGKRVGRLKDNLSQSD